MGISGEKYETMLRGGRISTKKSEGKGRTMKD
jgi:hypothetical protein